LLAVQSCHDQLPGLSQMPAFTFGWGRGFVGHLGHNEFCQSVKIFQSFYNEVATVNSLVLPAAWSYLLDVDRFKFLGCPRKTRPSDIGQIFGLCIEHIHFITYNNVCIRKSKFISGTFQEVTE